jgi:hypothetical protein
MGLRARRGGQGVDREAERDKKKLKKELKRTRKELKRTKRNRTEHKFFFHTRAIGRQELIGSGIDAGT